MFVRLDVAHGERISSLCTHVHTLIGKCLKSPSLQEIDHCVLYDQQEGNAAVPNYNFGKSSRLKKGLFNLTFFQKFNFLFSYTHLTLCFSWSLYILIFNLDLQNFGLDRFRGPKGANSPMYCAVKIAKITPHCNVMLPTVLYCY